MKNTRYAHYIQYSDVCLVDVNTHVAYTFDTVYEAGEWLAAQGIAATPNAARTGIYYLLESRMRFYKNFVLFSCHTQFVH